MSLYMLFVEKSGPHVLCPIWADSEDEARSIAEELVQGVEGVQAWRIRAFPNGFHAAIGTEIRGDRPGVRIGKSSLQ